MERFFVITTIDCEPRGLFGPKSLDECIRLIKDIIEEDKADFDDEEIEYLEIDGYLDDGQLGYYIMETSNV